MLTCAITSTGDGEVDSAEFEAAIRRLNKDKVRLDVFVYFSLVIVAFFSSSSWTKKKTKKTNNIKTTDQSIRPCLLRCERTRLPKKTAWVSSRKMETARTADRRESCPRLVSKLISWKTCLECVACCKCQHTWNRRIYPPNCCWHIDKEKLKVCAYHWGGWWCEERIFYVNRFSPVLCKLISSFSFLFSSFQALKELCMQSGLAIDGSSIQRKPRRKLSPTPTSTPFGSTLSTRPSTATSTTRSPRFKYVYTESSHVNNTPHAFVSGERKYEAAITPRRALNFFVPHAYQLLLKSAAQGLCWVPHGLELLIKIHRVHRSSSLRS